MSLQMERLLLLFARDEKHWFLCTPNAIDLQLPSLLYRNDWLRSSSIAIAITTRIPAMERSTSLFSLSLNFSNALLIFKEGACARSPVFGIQSARII
jgi:hypothetical protein